MFAPILDLEGHRDRNLFARTRKADHPREQAREQSLAALNRRHAFGAELMVEIVHRLQRLRQRIPGVAQKTPIERRSLVA
jgi:hypothetical protein